MIFFCLVFFVLSVWAYVELFCQKRINRILQIVMLATVFLGVMVSAVRTGRAGDFENYKAFFDQVSVSQILQRESGFEMGYAFLNLIVKWLFGNFHMFLGIESLLVFGLFLGFMLRIEDKAHRLYLCLLIMWALGFRGIINVRQDISVALCLFSIVEIKNKRIFRFLLLTACALAFHRTAVVWILAYPVYHAHLSGRKWMLILAATVIFSAFYAKWALYLVGDCLGGVYKTRIEDYLRNAYSNNYGSIYSPVVKILKSMANAGLLTAVFFMLSSRFKQDPIFKGCLNLYMVSICIMIISGFTSPEFSRAAGYYNIVHIYLLTYLFRIRPGRYQKLIYLVFCAYLLMRMIVSIRGGGMYSYETIFGVWR